MNAEPLAIEDRDGARWITLQRPPLNVLDLPTIRALHLAIRPRSRRRDLKVIVLRSGIPGTFSAGVDVRDHGKDRVSDMLEAFHALFRLIDGMPQATVASVDGRCLGGGCELAVFCDILLATPGSVFAQPEIDIGCFPPVASALLPRIAGRAGLEMVLTGRPLTAPEAGARRAGDAGGRRPGGRDRGVRGPPGRKERRRPGRRPARPCGRAAGAADKALARTERIYRKELLDTADAEEGVAAFLEKRPPRWTDR